MKLRLIALLLALLILSGCTSGLDASETPGWEETDASSGTEAEEKRTVRCLTEVSAEGSDIAVTYTVTYTEEGITLASAAGSYGGYASIFDLQGRLIREEEYDEAGMLTGYSVYEYDKNGNRVSIYNYYDAQGTVCTYWLYFYNEENLLTRSEDWNRDGLLVGATDYTYYENGKLKTETLWSIINDVVVLEEYSQDDQGRTVLNQYTHYLYPDWSGTFTYAYDGQGRLVSALWDDNSVSSDISDCFYTYNAVGQLTAYLEKTEFSTHSNYEYTYDDQGYLTSRTDAEDGIITVLTYGELELPASVAEAAQYWSRDGVIDYFCTAPDPKI